MLSIYFIKIEFTVRNDSNDVSNGVSVENMDVGSKNGIRRIEEVM